jgi:uncharacterized lipoprotein YddW (UPF0748 family)
MGAESGPPPAGASADARPAAEAFVLPWRGVWVARWDLKSPEELVRILETAAQEGFNQIYLQVRGEADAYYRSSLEPWAQPLGGTLGQDPGWDPLGLALEQARRLGLEIHAWVNVASAWKGASPPPPSQPRHILLSHPEWRVVDARGRTSDYSESGYAFVNPTHPGFQEHLLRVLDELLERYPVDGLHLDYCRFPAPDTSFDRDSRRRFAAARKADPSLDRAAWQRRELAAFVERIRSMARARRPGLVVSAAVTGIYRDRFGWGNVAQGYFDFHQDSFAWAEQGALDALVPMIYWPPTDPPGGWADFATLAREFAPLRDKVRLLAGINVASGPLPVLRREIELAREEGFSGVVLFSWRGLIDRNLFGRLRQELFLTRPPAVSVARELPPARPPR